MSTCIITYDIGSTGCKTCLYRLDQRLELLASAMGEYRFTTLANGGVEQDPDDWWKAMVVTSNRVLADSGMGADDVAGISFCAQMQGLVLVDSKLQVLRPAMSYMDQRAAAEKKASVEHGIQVEGVNLRKLIKSLGINGAVAASVKDPVWKYLWVKKHEPDVFARIHRWLDVKDYLIARATGACTMTRDSAFATFLTDQRQNPSEWCPALMKMYGVEPGHLPRLIDATDQAGTLLAIPAAELGLSPGTPVFGGGGDVSMISVGSGSTREGDCYVYTGTSGWVATTVRRQKVDVKHRIAAIVGAQPGFYNYFGEQETAGKCLEWVRDHLALDEINLYLQKIPVTHGPEAEYRSMYDFLIESIGQVPPGSGGVIFTPWLHGNRSPFEDPAARGMFFNLGLHSGKRMLIRAVVEGVIFHQRWLFEAVARGFPVEGPVRFAGGGALSPALAQILADNLERPVQTIAYPQNAGATGAALTAAIGLGVIPGFTAARDWIPVEQTIEPNPENFAVYRRQFQVFKDLYHQNKSLFARINTPRKP